MLGLEWPGKGSQVGNHAEEASFLQRNPFHFNFNSAHKEDLTSTASMPVFPSWPFIPLQDFFSTSWDIVPLSKVYQEMSADREGGAYF